VSGILPVIAALLAMQGAEVTASVDRTHLRVGEELMLTIRAHTRAADPVEIMLPSLNGFAIVGSRDLTEVAISGVSGSIRTTVRELQLRAQQPGALLIGPVRARQGVSVVSTDPILVTIDSAADRTASTLSPLARSLLESTPLPVSRRSDRVALTMLVPSDTVFAGQQVDLIAAAWVPRELGERMRRPPLLTLVTPEGVWAYPTATSSGVALSRHVSGRWMDLFIAHQVVFPLVAGRLIVPPASVEYALPVTFSFFSREERYTLRSDSIAITVLPLPPANPATNVVGQGLKLDLQIDQPTTRVGEPVEASITISGIGNVALWPPPEPGLRWPAGFRVYPAQTEVRVATDAGRIAGSKTFHFLAVPDSSGNFVLPEVRYPYFDATAGRYGLATAAPRALAVAPGAEPRAARVLLPLLPARGELTADRLSRRLGWAGWLALLLVPPVIALVARRRGRRAPAAAVVTAGPALTPLGRLEREFLAVLASHVSDPFARDGDGLAPALRAAGVDSAVADHVKRLRDRLRAARYGPRGLGDAAELGAEIEQVLRVLGAERSAVARRPHATVTLAAMLVVSAAIGEARHAAPLQSQAPSAEALFEAGALRAAADSFAARAAREPRDPAHWYNLGATLYRAGADGKATATWTRAARLAPRDPAIRRALRLLPPPDPVTEQMLRVGWATPAEGGVIAALGWVLLWLTVAVGSRRRVVIALLGAVAIAASLLSAIEWRRRDQPVAIVIADAAPVRAAPYGGASAAATVQAGGAVLVGRTYGPWVEVHRKDGIHGWVLGAEIGGL